MQRALPSPLFSRAFVHVVSHTPSRTTDIVTVLGLRYLSSTSKRRKDISDEIEALFNSRPKLRTGPKKPSERSLRQLLDLALAVDPSDEPAEPSRRRTLGEELGGQLPPERFARKRAPVEDEHMTLEEYEARRARIKAWRAKKRALAEGSSLPSSSTPPDQWKYKVRPDGVRVRVRVRPKPRPYVEPVEEQVEEQVEETPVGMKEFVQSVGKRLRPDAERSQTEERAPTYVGRFTVRHLEPITTIEPDYVQSPVAELEHGLDRVLFNPGVHWLSDPHSGVYNFTPHLETVPDIQKFDFKRLHGYVRSSEDTTMTDLAQREGKKFTGSSSSLTGLLSHIYRLMSDDKPVDLRSFSMPFAESFDDFTVGMKIPATVKLARRGDVWAVDPDSLIKDDDEKHALLWMGTMLEKFLTRSPESFAQLMEDAPPVPAEPGREPYRFSKSDKFVMRGQLDCVDRRLPGTGVFDIKTRAAAIVRHDRFNVEAHGGYELTQRLGLEQSFEREDYDMLRSAFLKYALQARVGDMDGIIVAYHNTKKVMGFQYFPLSVMEQMLFGSPEPSLGERIFKSSVRLLEEILEFSTTMFPESDISLTFDKRPSNVMHVYIKALTGYPSSVQPMALIEVSIKSYRNGRQVGNRDAIAVLGKSWEIEYTMRRATVEHSTILAMFDDCKSRQEFPWPIPPDMSREEMVEWYKQYNALGKEPTSATPDEGVPEFILPSPYVKNLRRIASRGHERNADRKAAGKRRVVFGIVDEVEAGAVNRKGKGNGVAERRDATDGLLEQEDRLPRPDRPIGGTFSDDMPALLAEMKREALAEAARRKHFES